MFFSVQSLTYPNFISFTRGTLYFQPVLSERTKCAARESGFLSPRSDSVLEFGTKRSQVQILSPRPKIGRKSSNFRLVFMQISQSAVFGTFRLQLFCNLSECTKRPQGSIYCCFAIFNYYILHFIVPTFWFCATASLGKFPSNTKNRPWRIVRHGLHCIR